MDRSSFDRSGSDLSSGNDAEKEASLVGVGIPGSDKDSVAGIEVGNGAVEEECVAVEADGGTVEED